MAKPLIRMKQCVALFMQVEVGDTFMIDKDKIQHLYIRCDTIHENDGETVAWNAVNLSTGETTHINDDSIVKMVNIEIEVSL